MRTFLLDCFEYLEILVYSTYCNDGSLQHYQYNVIQMFRSLAELLFNNLEFRTCLCFVATIAVINHVLLVIA